MERPYAAVLAVLAAAAACSSSGVGGSGEGSDAGTKAGVDSGSSGSGGSSGSSSTSSSSGSSSGSSTSSGSSGGSSSGSSSGGSSGSSSGSSGGDAGGCGEFTGDTTLTCSGDGNSLGDCVGGTADVTACPNGCLHEPSPQASICMGTTATNFSCTGSYGTVPVNDGNYYLTEFGCYIDANGMVQTDPDDNCIPSCLSQAIAAGLCPAGSTGPACEEKINYYTADGARFGCLARLRVTNPANGNALIAVALDFGPACSGENKVSHAVLDASGPVDDYLFGGAEGSSDMAVVHVVQVDDATPLGPL